MTIFIRLILIGTAINTVILNQNKKVKYSERLLISHVKMFRIVGKIFGQFFFRF